MRLSAISRLYSGGPAMGGEICAGENDGATQVFKTLGVRDCGGSIRGPTELVGMGRGETTNCRTEEPRAVSASLRACAEHSEAPERRKLGAWEDELTGLMSLLL